MPRRMSNRDRIDRMREEADAKAKEKPAPKEPKAKKGAAPAPTGRMKIVWAVCAVNGSIVRTFPYPQKESAEAEVKRLSEEKPHHLRAEKVPFDE
ncbi:MAG: hypothetical protein ACHQ1G_08100 [Planctomycetota bacterium]